LEITLGGVRLRFDDERLVAWIGGEFETHIGSSSLPAGHAAFVCGGDEIKIDRPKIGCHAWLAVSGGIDVPIVLESRSTDLRASFGGFNGHASRDADQILLGVNSAGSRILIEKLRDQKIADWKPPNDWSSPAHHEPVLRFVRGAHWDRFDASSLHRFTNETFDVLSESDRMGVRLEGPQLKRNDDVDLISEAVAPGTVQVPPGGKPILLLGDCQTIGGYPKIAHVITVDLPIAAQLRGGDSVRFREVALAEAHQLLAERHHHLEQFRIGLETQFS
jgi:antagonist of KipI